jgi:tripartite ATP-independent transporter DctP family solute receptor
MKKQFNALFRAVSIALGFALLTGCAQNPAEVSSESGSPSALLTNDSAIVYDVTPEYVFTYAENQTEDYPTTQGAYRFAQLVNERTKGRIQIRVYAGAQLGDETSTLEQLRFGGLDFARCSLSTMTAYSKMSNALMLPYLYRDADHMWAVLEGEIGRKVSDSFIEAGLVPLSWYDAGVRNFYFTKPVSSLEEMQGLIIRVQPVEMMEDMIRLLGATALPVSYENVYSAIQRGEADGAENNWSSYDAMRHNEVAPYYLLDEHMRVPESQIVSAVTWNLLSEEDQQIIRKCSALSADYERQLWTAREEEAKQRVLDSGCKEIKLSEDEKKKFRDAMEPLYEKYCGDYMNLVEEIRQVGVQRPQ